MTYAAESADKWSELATKFRADGAGGSQLGAFSGRDNEFKDVAPWHLDDATSDILRAQFKSCAAEAARALGASLKGPSSLNLWLHHVYQFLVYEHSARPRPCLVVSSADRDGTTVHVESPTIDNVFAASAAFCLSLHQQALEGELPPKAQRFQAWIVGNSSAPKLPNLHCSMQGWISAVAKCATTPIPIHFLSARLNVCRLPQRPAELRAFFDHVARQEGLIWGITERGLWMAQEPPKDGVYIDSNGRKHGRVRIDRTNAASPKSAFSPSSKSSKFASGFTPSGDYQTIEFEGKRYQLTRLAAAIVRELHTAHQKNAGGLSSKLLRKATDCKKVWDAFRVRDGRAFWKKLIRKPSKDVYRLGLE